MRKRPATYKIIWRDIHLVIRHELDYLWKGTSHVEVHVVHPKRAPIPITETGYRSHFLPTLDLINEDSAVTFVEREAKSKTWQQRDFKSRQGDLFA